MTRLPATAPRPWALLLVLAFVVGACSSDDSTAADSAAQEASEAGTSQTDGATGDSTAERDNGTDGAGGGSELSEWCGYVSDVLASSAFSLDGLLQMTPQELESRLIANAEVTEGGLAASTDEIGPWVKVIDEAMQAAVVAGEEADWDILAMSENPIFFDQMTLNNLLIASEEIDFYNTETCGIPTNLSGQNGDAVSDAGNQETGEAGEGETAAGEVSGATGDESGTADDADDADGVGGENNDEESELAEGGRTLDDAEPIAPENATSSGTAAAGSVGASTDLPGGSGAEVVDWFVEQMGIPKSAFADQTWDCLAAEIDQAYPDGVESGPLDPELQALVTASLGGCGFG